MWARGCLPDVRAAVAAQQILSTGSFAAGAMSGVLLEHIRSVDHETGLRLDRDVRIDTESRARNQGRRYSMVAVQRRTDDCARPLTSAPRSPKLSADPHGPLAQLVRAHA